MAAGAAGPSGDPALRVKGQGPEAATTPHPAEVANTAPDCSWSRSPARMETSSSCSKDMHTQTLSCNIRTEFQAKFELKQLFHGRNLV